MFKIVTRAAALVAVSGAAALAFAGPAAAVDTDRYIEVAQCATPQTQICKQIPSVSFTTKNERSIKVEFTANRNHCSDIVAHIFIDGKEWGANRVGPGRNDGGYEIPVSAGTHTIGVQAEGVKGGCNIGYLSAWGGVLHIESLQDPNTGTTITPNG